MSIYCVYLTVYKGNKLPPFYIGFSSISKINKGYRGSVCSKKYKKIWKNELKENPQLFKTYIISEHKTETEAKSKETIIQRTFQVHKNPMYINASIQNEKFYLTREQYKELVEKRLSDPLYHSQLSERNRKLWADPVWKEKQKIALKKSKNTSEYRNKQSRISKEIGSRPEYKKKISESNKKVWSDSNHKAKRCAILQVSANNPDLIAHRKRFKWWTNGIDTVHSPTCPEGYRPGRK